MRAFDGRARGHFAKRAASPDPDTDRKLAMRQRSWSVYVRHAPDANEQATIRRGSETGQSYGACS